MNVTRLPKEAMEDMSFFIKNPDSVILKLIILDSHKVSTEVGEYG